MEVALPGVIGFFSMATAAMLSIWVWDDDWSMTGGLLYLLALPTALLALLLLQDFRWESIVAAAAGLAVGMAVGVVGTFDTSDSGTDLLWLAAFYYASFGFIAYTAIGAAFKAAVTAIRLYRRD